MRISNITTVNFTGNYDIHVHTGRWWGKASQNTNGAVELSPGNYRALRDFGPVDTLEIANKLITNPDDKIEKMFVSNLDCMVRNHPVIKESSLTDNGTPFLQNEIDGNLALLSKYRRNKNYVLYAVCQPGYGNVSNIEQVFRKGPKKFKGLKFHPKQLDIPADAKCYDEYMDFAQKKNLPCLFHSQVNVDYQVPGGRLVEDMTLWDKSDPEFIYRLAKRHPSVPVILAHTGAGGTLAHNKAIEVLLNSIDKKDANLYCDISWVDFENGLPADKPGSVIDLIKKLKERNALDRLMFGTDSPLGCYGEAEIPGLKPEKAYKLTVEKLKNAIRMNFDTDSEKIISKIFYENARDLFFGADNVQSAKKGIKKSHKIIGGIISAFIGVGALLSAFNSGHIPGHSGRQKPDIAVIR